MSTCGVSTLSSRSASFATGRTMVPILVFISAARTTLFLPTIRRMTRPYGHTPRGDCGSTTSTRSPFSRFLTSFVHFLHSMRENTYFLSHLFQMWTVSTRAWRHRFLLETSLSTKTWGCRFGFGHPNRKWLGVKTSSSVKWVLTCVRGRPLSKDSTSFTMVKRTLLVSFWFWRMACIARLHDLTRRFQIPSQCGADRGLKHHSMPSCNNELIRW